MGIHRWLAAWIALLTWVASAMPQPSARPENTGAFKAGSPGAQSGEQRKTPKARRNSGETTLTGCVDQKDGQYVLTEDTTLRTIAELRAASSNQDSFARHLGHRVTVRGELVSDGGRPWMRVRSLETVSQSCTPPQGS
jgi:hypothetical protein